MEFSIKTDNPVEAIAAAHMKTIFWLQNENANAATEAVLMRQQIESLTKERDALKPKDAPKLVEVPNEKTADSGAAA